MVARCGVALAISIVIVGCGGSSSESPSTPPEDAVADSTHAAASETTNAGEGDATSSPQLFSLPENLCGQFAPIQHELAPGDVLTSYSGPLDSVQLQSMTALLSEAHPKVEATSGYACQSTPKGELQDAAVSSSEKVVVISRTLSEEEARGLTYLGLDDGEPVQGIGDWAFFEWAGLEGPVITFQTGTVLAQVQGVTENSEGIATPKNMMIRVANEALLILTSS